MTEFNRAAVVFLLSTLLILSLEAHSFTSTYWKRRMELTERFNNILGETPRFLDEAWEVARMFKDPDFDYDPSQLANSTAPEVEIG